MKRPDLLESHPRLTSLPHTIEVILDDVSALEDLTATGSGSFFVPTDRLSTSAGAPLAVSLSVRGFNAKATVIGRVLALRTPAAAADGLPSGVLIRADDPAEAHRRLQRLRRTCARDRRDGDVQPDALADLSATELARTLCALALDEVVLIPLRGEVAAGSTVFTELHSGDASAWIALKVRGVVLRDGVTRYRCAPSSLTEAQVAARGLRRAFSVKAEPLSA